MSNTLVGPVYDTIITEVINAVRVDFEENGVDDGALEDLKKVSRSFSAPFVFATASRRCPFARIPSPIHRQTGNSIRDLKPNAMS